MSDFEQDPILIPEGSVPLAAGEVTAVSGDVVELAEDVTSETCGFVSYGANSEEIFTQLEELYTKTSKKALLRIVKDQETGGSTRVPIHFGEARAMLETGTPQNAAVLQLVIFTQRQLRLDSSMVPEGVEVGERLGVWVDPNIRAVSDDANQTPFVVGKMAVTAIHRLP